MKPTRRRFLQSTLTLPIAGALGGGRTLLPGSFAPQAQDEEMFGNPLVIRYDKDCFIIYGRNEFIFSAAMHYPRCPKLLWRDRLEKLKRAGFNTIETYAFWNYHEPEEGKCDLSEFEEFIQLVKEMGFWMIARPGPYVCAEWHRGGFPDWVAAKRFPLRSNHPESLKTSEHWFKQILPVIQRHQITTGGPIIMVQVENEYDFSAPMPDAGKLEYIRALYQMCYWGGITVPIITCWTKEARENSDPAMAHIMDTCNFYPRWEVVKQVVPRLAKLREEEPTAPLGVTELQGGWFSKIGEKLSVDQEGVDGAQLNLLTKTVIEQDVTYFNYYMGFGGTNFDWAAKTNTTTYDYAAPIREPGGLWEKYYAARGIGASLGVFGEILKRSTVVERIPQSTNPNVSVTERVRDKAGVVFVRENANAEQRFKMYVQDPFSPTKRIISAPREGELTIGPREMKMLPVGIPIPGSRLRYTTGEVLARGLIVDRHYLIVYDEPGRIVELGLATRDEPQVQGDYAYNYWDPAYESVVLGVQVGKTEKVLLVNNHLLLVVMPRERALRSWIAEFPSDIVPGSEEREPMLVPFLTDSYLLGATGSDKKRIWAELDFQPGEHWVKVLLPPTPVKCLVDGAETRFAYERQWRSTQLILRTPQLPYQSIATQQVESWTETFDTGLGEWQAGSLRALEDLGEVPYGYVKYRAEFTHQGEQTMFIRSFTDDVKKVFINGKLALEASNIERETEFPLASYAQGGSNTIEIAYERFGSYNFGKEINDLSGIESVRVGTDAQTAKPIESWQVQRFPAAMRGREIDPQFPEKGWRAVTLGEANPAAGIVPAFTWCRAEISLPSVGGGWSVPWKLVFEAGRDALLYLNGRFIGRYATVGPQTEFYLPETFLTPSAKENILTIVLAYADQAHHIRTLRVAPYEEYATRHTRVEFEW